VVAPLILQQSGWSYSADFTQGSYGWDLDYDSDGYTANTGFVMDSHIYINYGGNLRRLMCASGSTTVTRVEVDVIYSSVPDPAYAARVSALRGGNWDWQPVGWTSAEDIRTVQTIIRADGYTFSAGCVWLFFEGWIERHHVGNVTVEAIRVYGTGENPFAVPYCTGTIHQSGSDPVSLRSEPSINGTIWAQLAENNVVTIFGRTADSQWLYVNHIQSGHGWVTAEAVINQRLGIEPLQLCNLNALVPIVNTTGQTLTPTVTPTPTPDPTICTSRQLGTVNLRTQPNFNESAPRQLTDGTVRFVGRYVSGDDIWLRVSGYYVAGSGTLDTTAVGWIHLSAFGGVEPCGSGSILSLPLLDQTGNPVPTPTPNPNMTPTASATPPVSASPICLDALTNVPVRLRSAPTFDNNEVLYVESYTPVDIYWLTNSGGIYNGSTTWYYISLDYGVPSQRYFGWMHSTVIDARTCPPIITITPSPTLTPTPSNTPPPDLSSVFPLPMIAPDAAHPVRQVPLTGCLNFGYGIPSIDVNPIGLTEPGFPVQLPARATILAVDNNGVTPPGIFDPGLTVYFRIDIRDIPPEIRLRLATLNAIDGYPEFQNISAATQQGSIHIQYAHLRLGTIPSTVVTPKSWTEG
jgi:hypothetical protein